ncbi:hypothetical protein [Candidatus Solirubrobacter pratensis]|uniref:hypothetical protein n=1 Tax=Candidatus Solirubrobacter pratensis TaxID=1298857 RepID=UPI0003F8EF4D|nr:hypothetical protein [Candidatus Solirubrobacter pratensis]
MRRALVLALALFLAAACGGSKASSDPVQSVPDDNGVRAAVQNASAPAKGEFPSAAGKSLEQLANTIKAGPQLAMASSVFTVGQNRIAFGVIANDGVPVYGQTALYVAPSPDKPAEGPFTAPADVLLTEKRYRSKQAALTSDPFYAVYGAHVPFSKSGRYAVLSATKTSGGALTGATATVDVVAKSADPIPEVGTKAPKVHTDTLASAKGDVTKIDTRQPPSDMHAVDFADVVGKKPVALLFSTPQLCQSRVCGPVTDIALQMKSSYGDRMDFIHQEVYVDNNAQKGLRKPLLEFHLQTEPWLFVVNKQGIITARLEGSIGVRAFENAVKTGL